MLTAISNDSISKRFVHSNHKLIRTNLFISNNLYQSCTLFSGTVVCGLFSCCLFFSGDVPVFPLRTYISDAFVVILAKHIISGDMHASCQHCINRTKNIFADMAYFMLACRYIFMQLIEYFTHMGPYQYGSPSYCHHIHIVVNTY